MVRAKSGASHAADLAESKDAEAAAMCDRRIVAPRAIAVELGCPAESGFDEVIDELFAATSTGYSRKTRMSEICANTCPKKALRTVTHDEVGELWGGKAPNVTFSAVTYRRLEKHRTHSTEPRRTGQRQQPNAADWHRNIEHHKPQYSGSVFFHFWASWPT